MALVEFMEGTPTGGKEKVLSSNITQTDSNSVDTLKIICEDTVTILLGDEVKNYDASGTYIFGGYVTKLTSKFPKEITIEDYGNELKDTLINEVYRSQSPEAIISDIVGGTSLTYSSSVSSGVTIDKIVFKDERAIDVISQLLPIFNGNWRTDKNKIFYLETRQENAASVSIAAGVDLNISGWKTDNSKQAQKIIVKGGVIKQRSTESFSGTNTLFTLSRIPEDIRVTVSGVEKVQTVDGQIDGDYTVDKQNKTITFDTSVTNPVVEYTYDSIVKVTAGIGTPQREIVKPYLESMSEARKFALDYLSLYSNGIQSSTWKTQSLDLDNYKPNYSISVIDSISNPTVSGDFIIQKTVRKYPGTIEVTLGEDEESIFDWQKEAQERLKQLEKKDENTDFIQLYDFTDQGITVSLSLDITRYQQRGTESNSFYYDTSFYDSNDLYAETPDDDAGTAEEWVDI